MNFSKKGLFVTIEGIDGSGKSTQAGKISKWLEDFTGFESLRTFEPGGWQGGEKLRDLILNDKNFDGISELLLFLADRAGHLSKIIIPAIESGKNVICERYTDSTFAYQSGGHGIDFEQLKKIIESCKFPEPDVTIFLDIAPELAIKRIKNRNRNKNKNDKFESEGLKLMKLVSDSYKRISDENPDRFINVHVENYENEEEIFNKIINILQIKSIFSKRDFFIKSGEK